jgi:hypothetical protein
LIVIRTSGCKSPAAEGLPGYVGETGQLYLSRRRLKGLAAGRRHDGQVEHREEEPNNKNKKKKD